MKVIEKYKNEIEEARKNGRNIIACMCNYEVRPLSYEIGDNDEIELLDTSTKDGKRIYVRGLLYIMGKAFNELYPEALLTVNYQLSDAMYCQIDNMQVTTKIIDNIRNKMQEIIARDLEIKKVIMTKEEAENFYNSEKTLRGKLQLDNRQKEGVSLYFCEEYYNYFYGVMPISTSYVTIFEIFSYHDGFLIRYPSNHQPNTLEPYKEGKKLLKTLEEYEDIHKILRVDTVYRLNKLIQGGKAKDIILLSEALHEKKIADIADDIVRKKGVKMVLIAGPSSSGKTTFAKRLGIQLRLNGLKPVTISVDNYFVERKDNPKDEFGNYDFECLEAIDLDLFNRDLTTLLQGGEVLVPTFNFKTGEKEYHGETMRLGSDEILVMEGIHCLNDKLTMSVPVEEKYKIYTSDLTVLNIDYYNRISTTDTRLIRRMVRDNNFRGNDAMKTLSTWDSVNKGERKNIFPFQENCDIMFNSSLIYELSVLKRIAMPLLEKIKPESREYAEAKRIYEMLKYLEPIGEEDIPKNSILREFIDGSIFDY